MLVGTGGPRAARRAKARPLTVRRGTGLHFRWLVPLGASIILHLAIGVNTAWGLLERLRSGTSLGLAGALTVFSG